MRFILTIIIAVISLQLHGQAEDLVVWTAAYDKASSSITLKADMKDDWVIYSQNTDPEGPIPLEIEFEDIEGVEYVGHAEELSDAIVEMSEMFGVEVIKFKEQAEFAQKVKVSQDGVIVKGNVTFMTCDSKRCLPPKTVPFEVKI